MKLPTAALAKDYSIERVIVGCWQLAGGHGSVPKETAIDNLARYFEQGFRTFDCADIYTGVEELLGNFTRICRRRFGNLADELKVHTKFVPDRDRLPDIDRRYVQGIIDRSLKRLQVERLDMVQFHWWDLDISGYVETACTLAELQAAGKIHHIGLTNFDAPQVEEIISAGVSVVSNQVQYSLCDRRPQTTMTPSALKHNYHLLCYGTVAGGFLSDQYLGAARPNPPLANRSLVKYMLIIDEIGGWDVFQSLLQTIHQVAEKHQTGVANVAIRYVLDQACVAAAIIGSRNTTHLRDAVKLCNLTLDEQDRKIIDGQLSQIPHPPGGVYELERDRAGEHAAIMKYNLNSIVG